MEREQKRPTLYSGYKVKVDLEIGARLYVINDNEIYEANKEYYFTLLDTNNTIYSDAFKNKYKIENMNYNGTTRNYVLTTKINSKNLFTDLEKMNELLGFASVAGMKDLKRQLREEVIEPFQNPEKYKKFKISIPNGYLFYGPPGCGKTYIANKLAEEMNLTFIATKHSDLAAPYIHGATNKIGDLFRNAKENAPCILFIDEIDGILPKRSELSGGADFRHEEVNEFLMQLNNISEHKVLVIGATNQIDSIDDAILRTGRLDKKIFISLPDQEAREELFKLSLFGRPIADDIDYKILGKLTDGLKSSDIGMITNDSARAAMKINAEFITHNIIESQIKAFVANSQ